MKVKILVPCEKIIKNELTILDVNRVIIVDDTDAFNLISNGVAENVEKTTVSNNDAVVNAENKMINIIYKKRGRPRKED